MSKRQVSRVLAIYFTILWAAVVLRVDRFPLTWAPMYSTLRPATSDRYGSLLHDHPALDAQGWRVEYRNGETGWLPRAALNLPRRSMWRYYYHATFERDTAKRRHMNAHLTGFEERVWGLEPGEPYTRVDWHRRLFYAVNRTLGRAPADDCFVVRFTAESTTQNFSVATLAVLDDTHATASAHFASTWAGDFGALSASAVPAPAAGCQSLLGGP